MPNNTYNKLILLTGASLLNSQERSCTTPNISPKNIKTLIIIVIYLITTYQIIRLYMYIKMALKKKFLIFFCSYPLFFVMT